MNNAVHTVNELQAAVAFDKQAALFDEMYSSDQTILYKRNRVRSHALQWLQPGSDILELNAGTGEDAVFFASLGHRVHATDFSFEMQRILSEKVVNYELQNNIKLELCSYTKLNNLFNRGPFDMIFSNFAGLNCTNKLDDVLGTFDKLLKPGGYVTLVLLPKFCLWELLMIFRGKFRTAFRRFSGKKGAQAHIEGEYFRCWYYNPSFIQKQLKGSFDLVGLEGLCSIVPPSYLERFGQKFPKSFQWMKKKEDQWKSKWPWKTIGDYYIITLKKKKKMGQASDQFKV